MITIDPAPRVRSEFLRCLPAMAADGGGATLTVDEDTGIIVLSLIGTCLYCPSRIQSARTLASRLRAADPEGPAIRVVAIVADREELLAEL